MSTSNEWLGTPRCSHSLRLLAVAIGCLVAVLGCYQLQAIAAVDNTCKVAAATANGEHYTCALNYSSTCLSPGSMTCYYSSGGQTWNATSTYSLENGACGYESSGIYLMPGMTSTTNTTDYIYAVGYNSLNGADEIDRWSISNSTVTALSASALPNCFGSVCPLNIGPRLAVAHGYGSGSTSTVWIFGVIPSNGNQGAGHLLALNIGSEGAGTQTWTDVSQSFTPTSLFDANSSNPPIAADNSASSQQPLVAVRKDSTHLALLSYDGTNWSEFDSAAIPTTNLAGNTIGNSIAIAPMPRNTVGYYYDWDAVIVTAADAHLWEIYLYQCPPKQLHCIQGEYLSSWIDLGAGPGTFETSTGDSLAATTDPYDGSNWFTVYAKGSSGGIAEDYTANYTLSGTVGSAGWQTMTAGSSWTGYTFLGLQTANRTTENSLTYDEVYGLCNTSSGTTTICEVARQNGYNTFSWTYP